MEMITQLVRVRNIEMHACDTLTILLLLSDAEFPYLLSGSHFLGRVANWKEITALNVGSAPGL